jgi:hypothetical protein
VIKGVVDHLYGLGFIDPGPVAIYHRQAHGAESKRRNRPFKPAEPAIFHGFVLPWRVIFY